MIGTMSEQERVEKIHKYFKYNYNGIITNVHSDFTLRLAGSDF